MAERRVGLLGATSLVGECLIARLRENGWQVTAYSRQTPGAAGNGNGVGWRRLPTLGLPSPSPPLPAVEGNLPLWVCLAPIWVLPDYFPLLEAYGARRVVALSSTSRFTKANSADAREHALAQRLKEGEERLRTWAEEKRIEWVVLRPTLIYGRGKDRNLSEIARFIRRFGFFPVLGRATGLRQPVHAEDVAAVCAAALASAAAANRAYDLSGGETLSYREMVGRVFTALHRPARMLSVPLGVFRLAVSVLRVLPRCRHWSAAMAERMNRDLVFDHADAARELEFSPRPFRLESADLPD